MVVCEPHENDSIKLTGLAGAAGRFRGDRSVDSWICIGGSGDGRGGG